MQTCMDNINSDQKIMIKTLSEFENRLLLRPMLGSMDSVAHFIIGHEKTQ